MLRTLPVEKLCLVFLLPVVDLLEPVEERKGRHLLACVYPLKQLVKHILHGVGDPALPTNLQLDRKTLVLAIHNFVLFLNPLKEVVVDHKNTVFVPLRLTFYRFYSFNNILVNLAVRLLATIPYRVGISCGGGAQLAR